MIDRVVAHVRAKPRTTALIGVGLLGLAGILLWDARRGGSLYAYLPLLLCLGMHGLMHGGHGHGRARKEPEAPPTEAPAPARITADRRDDAA